MSPSPEHRIGMPVIQRLAVPKRPYVAPALKVYGSLEELTQRVSKRGRPDGGILLLTRTGGSCSGNASGDCAG
jgi:hypothetical protein